MKLTTKFTLVLVAVAFVHVVVHWWTSVDRERAIFDTITRDDHRLLGHALHHLALGVQGRIPPAELESLVNALPHGRETRTHWTWLRRDSVLSKGGPLSDADWIELSEGRTISRLGSAPDDELALCVVPLEPAGDRIAALEIEMSLFRRAVFQRRELVELVLLMISILVVTPLLIFAIGHILLGRPLDVLVQMVRRVSAGDLCAEVHLPQRDELGFLGDRLTEMAANLRRSQEALVKEEEATRSAHLQLWHLDRLALLGQMAAGVAHEVGTPLNVIQGHARLIENGGPDPESAKSSARTIREQTLRITQILNDMLGLARRRVSPREPTDLRTLAAATIRLIAAAHRVTPRLVVEGDGSVAPLVTVDPAQIQQVLTNLIVNAIQATGGTGEIVVGIVPDKHKSDGTESQPLAALYVQDDGPGVPAEIRERVFEPFFTTKEANQGSGLGLSIAREIVTEHGGCLRVDSQERPGACFWIVLPRTGVPA